MLKSQNSVLPRLLATTVLVGYYTYVEVPLPILGGKYVFYLARVSVC